MERKKSCLGCFQCESKSEQTQEETKGTKKFQQGKREKQHARRNDRAHHAVVLAHQNPGMSDQNMHV